MAQKLILAKSITEANQYAKAAGLERFTYRSVRSAGSIRGVRHAEVHLLSSFARRIDRHAILGALRWAKTLEVFYVDFDRETGEILDGSERADNPETDDHGPSERELEVAYRYNALLDAAKETDAPTAETEPSEDPAPAAPVKRRRTRCAECGNLHFKDEACPPVDEQDTPGSVPTASFF